MDSDEEPRSADTVIGFLTEREGELCDALPAGPVRVYMRDAKGQHQFVGKNGIGYTPIGSRLVIKDGRGFLREREAGLDKRGRILRDE